jgi:hypothetical protein
VIHYGEPPARQVGCSRAAVIQRLPWTQTSSNALFYKTEKGAEVGDLFMSLIYTCELNHANPFDYLTELQKHAGELAENLAAWMPWNYQATLRQVRSKGDSV